jgi:hypothetical protein
MEQWQIDRQEREEKEEREETELHERRRREDSEPCSAKEWLDRNQRRAYEDQKRYGGGQPMGTSYL